MATKIYLNADELAKVKDVYTKAQTDTLLNSKADTSDLADKQDILVSGSNIKTINNESVLGSGNIVISGGSTDYDALTDKPIVNQDLDDGSFSPSANTYYRHIGASATTYTIGGIYYYDGADFNLIDGSKGLTSVTASDVDSESATSGQVLQADGLGGASWQTPSTPTIEGTSILSTGATNGQVLMADGVGNVNWQNVPSGSSDIVIDLGDRSISGVTDVLSYLTQEQKAQIVDTSVNNVYIKFNDISGDIGNVILKRQRTKIGNPLDKETTEVYFISADAQENYGQYGYEISTNMRYIFWYIYDYDTLSERAYIQRVTLGKLDSINFSISGFVTNCGDTLPLDNYSFFEDGVSGNIRVKFTGRVLNGTYADGDTISDSEFLYCAENQYELQINGKRFIYQKKDFNGITLQSTVTYLSSELDGTLIKLTIMKLNTTTGLVNFTEQVVNDGLVYITTAPTGPNTNGLMKLVVLDHDPATKYAGWLYYITQ